MVRNLYENDPSGIRHASRNETLELHCKNLNTDSFISEKQVFKRTTERLITENGPNTELWRNVLSKKALQV